MSIPMPSTPEQWCVAASAVCAVLAVVLGLIHFAAKLSRRLHTPAVVKLVRDRLATPVPVARVITPTADLIIPTDPWPAAPIPPQRRALQKPRLADPYVDWPTRRVPAVTITTQVEATVAEPVAALAGRGRLVTLIRGGRRRDTHQGAVPGWSPLSEVAAIDTADRLTPLEFLPREPLMDGLPEQSEPSTDVIRDDVHHALESIDAAIAAFRRGVDASITRFDRNVDAALVVFNADRRAKLRDLLIGELTGEMDMTELRAALNAVPKAERVAA